MINLKRTIPAILALLPVLAWAAAADNTASQYKPTTGPVGGVNGVVIQQSSDGYNATPINAAHPLPVTATVTPSGTQDVNQKQVNGQTINVGTGAAGTGTQRVTTSTDSTIGTVTNPVGMKGADGTAIVSNANPVPVSDAGGSLTVDAASLPLPSGAATAALQSGVQSAAGTPNATAVTVQGNASGVAMPVSGTVSVTDGAGSLNVIVDSSALPSGAATDASLTNGNLKSTAGVELLDSGGTNKASISAAGAVKVDNSGVTQPISDSASVDAATGSGSITSAIAVFSLDTTGYNGIGVNVTSVGSGNTITSQQSNDNSTWTSLVCARSDSSGSAPTANFGTAASYNCGLSQRYYRVNVSVYGSGTIAATYTLRRSPPANFVTQLSNVGGASGSGSTQAGNPLKIGGVFNTTQPTVTNGQVVDAQYSARGSALVTAGVEGLSIKTTGNAGANFDQVIGSAVPANAVMAGFSDGTNTQFAKVSADKAVMVTPVSPASGNILVGRQSFTSTTGATTLITITAGKTWVGVLNANVDCSEAAAGTVACKANATFTTVGANITPAAGTYFVCEATGGANAATGTVGSQGDNYCSTPFTAICASGSCTIAVASTNAGTASLVEASAIGNMQ